MDRESAHTYTHLFMRLYSQWKTAFPYTVYIYMHTQTHTHTQVKDKMCPKLHALSTMLSTMIDLEDSRAKKRITIQPGIDPELDDKKLRFEGISDFLCKIAQVCDYHCHMCVCVCIQVILVSILHVTKRSCNLQLQFEGIPYSV